MTVTMTEKEYEEYLRRNDAQGHIPVYEKKYVQPCKFDEMDPLKIYNLSCTCPKCQAR